MLKISKENLEMLFTSLIADNIKPALNGKGEKLEWFCEELLTNLKIQNDKAYLYIHFTYHTIYKNVDFEGQEIPYRDEIELTLSGQNDDTKEALEEMEKVTHIDKNGLYIIIQILKESI